MREWVGDTHLVVMDGFGVIGGAWYCKTSQRYKHGCMCVWGGVKREDEGERGYVCVCV